MPKEKRVLFLTARVGTGHLSAAIAIQQALQEMRPGIQTKIIDTYKYAGAFFGRVATQGYLQLIKLLPQIYQFFYDMQVRDSTIAQLKSKFTQTTAMNLKPFVREFSPDVIVCTHAFPSGVASILKDELPIPVVNVITDFTIHPFWIHSNIDLYLVGNAQLAHHLLKQGILREKIRVTGIPVDIRFLAKGEKEEIKKRIGLQPEIKTVLVMGGGIGLGPIGWILRSLRKVRTPIQVIVITGTNQGLKRRMERYAAKFNHNYRKANGIKRIQVYGYVNNVYDFMRGADLLISKPGGLTSSEALATEIPLLIVGPLPGPEICNARYLVKEKAAVMVKRPKHVPRQVDLLFNEPQRIAGLKERARALQKPEAAYEAAKNILEFN